MHNELCTAREVSFLVQTRKNGMGEPNEGGEQRQKSYKKGRDLDKASRLATNVCSGHRRVGEIVRLTFTRLRAWGSCCRTLRLRLEEDFSRTLTLSDCAAGAARPLRVYEHCMIMSCACRVPRDFIQDNMLRDPPGEAKDAVASVP